ncbi:MAG TPA: response regulator transcription factor [Gemmatimonadaceae bacterium]|nr:response regulator transcription factor [Gemmatimonadaceae bacterium]
MMAQHTGGVISSMESMPFSVMCIDDNILLIDALERRLNLEPGFTGLQRVDDLAHSVAAAERLQPSVVLLDIDLPGGVDALSILDELVQRLPDTRVLVFTGFPSGDLVRRTMSRGAWGFVSKGTTAETLIGAIRRVVAGQAVIELEE